MFPSIIKFTLLSNAITTSKAKKLKLYLNII